MDYIIGSVFYSRCATTVRFGIRCGTPPVKWMTAVIFTPGSDTRVTTTRVRTRDRLWDSLGRVPESIAQRPLCAHSFRTHALFMSIYWLFILFTWGKTQAANKQCVFAFVVVFFFLYGRRVVIVGVLAWGDFLPRWLVRDVRLFSRCCQRKRSNHKGELITELKS